MSNPQRRLLTRTTQALVAVTIVGTLLERILHAVKIELPFLPQISIVTALFGVIFYIERISDSFDDLYDQLSSRFDQLSGRFDDLNRQLAGRFDDLHKQLAAVASDRRDLDTLMSLYETGDRQPLEKIHVLATAAVLKELYRDRFRSDLAQAATLARSEKNNKKAELEDMSITFLLLRAMENRFPSGGVWLGITHIVSKESWMPDFKQGRGAFYEFVSRMRERARTDSVHVYRIFCVRSWDEYENLKAVIQTEIDSGIHIRIFVESGVEHFPSDMSLLWHPRHKEKAGTISEDDLTAAAPLNVTFQAKKLDPSCGLAFRSVDLQTLSAVTIYDPDSDEFTKLCGQFKDAWRRGKSVDDYIAHHQVAASPPRRDDRAASQSTKK